MNGPTVRLARPGDAAAIADAHVRGWLAAYRGLIPDAVLDGLSVERRTEQWRETITSQGPDSVGRTWVVEEAGKVKGFAGTGAIRDPPDDLAAAGEVLVIYLPPEARGKGLGRVIFRHAVEDLQARGFDLIVVWVFEANAVARRFYEAAGFLPDGGRQPVDFGEVAHPEIRYRLG